MKTKTEEILKILPIIENAIKEDHSEEHIMWMIKDLYGDKLFFTEIDPIANKIHSMIRILKENL